MKMTGSLEFIGLLLFMAGVELNPGPRTPDSNTTEMGKEQTYVDDASNISTRNMEEISEETTPKQTVDNINGGAQNIITDDDVNHRSEEPATKKSQQSQHERIGSNVIQPLAEPELVEFSDYITHDNQEKIAVMLGFGLNKVETLRGKHRENVTGVSLDLLIDWTRCNPQPTNRMVSNN